MHQHIMLIDELDAEIARARALECAIIGLRDPMRQRSTRCSACAVSTSIDWARSVISSAAHCRRRTGRAPNIGGSAAR
jgi:hypothetical protein